MSYAVEEPHFFSKHVNGGVTKMCWWTRVRRRCVLTRSPKIDKLLKSGSLWNFYKAVNGQRPRTSKSWLRQAEGIKIGGKIWQDGFFESLRHESIRRILPFPMTSNLQRFAKKVIPKALIQTLFLFYQLWLFRESLECSRTNTKPTRPFSEVKRLRIVGSKRRFRPLSTWS